MKPLVFFSVVISLLFFLSCSQVTISEKGLLADRMMVFDYNPAASSLHGHMIAPREGSIGGFDSVGAGGCSCK